MRRKPTNIVMDLVENKKLRKRDLDDIKKDDQRMEQYIKAHLTGAKRRTRYLDTKKYRKGLIRNALISGLTSITSLLGVMVAMSYIKAIPEKWVTYYVMGCTAFAIVASMFPLTWHSFVAVKQSEIHDYVYGKKIIERTISEVKFFIKKCKHYCDVLTTIELDMGKANVDILMKKSQIYSRKALFRLLRMTNNFLATGIFRFLSYKKRREVVHEVNELLKDTTGALVIAFKGRVPKYVTDAISRTGRNIFIVEGSE